MSKRTYSAIHSGLIRAAPSRALPSAETDPGGKYIGCVWKFVSQSIGYCRRSIKIAKKPAISTASLLIDRVKPFSRKYHPNRQKDTDEHGHIKPTDPTPRARI
ncbi:hypothetical protein HF669_04185 [Acidithiobacillus thiooxidans]|uniref:hypothetical protein n=1 Tax=Acidithiobacillus thiooxidans TaxID=930 RepID=UPI0011457802|nr:hypothetical protein [Acidithiobacillus thiooxidans]MBU2752451.1 hypothetical protein [Acidithiobacillus thiooxidans]MBU2810591.1 hypothetical protein [Acidithiobacillus thiooxidans]